MKGMLGIRREDRNPYERRAPLTPGHVKDLIANLGVEVRIQPSDIRVFSDGEYAEAGAVIQEDLSECALVLAVKEIPVDLFREGGTYMFFSHTIKGQEYNMPMLCRLMELKCQLIDYEKVTDDKNRRLIFFGREAGLAGMLNTLWALGGRLEWEGHKTAFREIAQTSNYMNLAEAREAVRQLGAQISAEGVPQKVGPVICGFAGYGNVSRGAQEIYDMLPVEVIRPRDLLELGGRGALANLSRKKVYKVVFKE